MADAHESSERLRRRGGVVGHAPQRGRPPVAQSAPSTSALERPRRGAAQKRPADGEGAGAGTSRSAGTWLPARTSAATAARSAEGRHRRLAAVRLLPSRRALVSPASRSPSRRRRLSRSLQRLGLRDVRWAGRRLRRRLPRRVYLGRSERRSSRSSPSARRSTLRYAPAANWRVLRGDLAPNMAFLWLTTRPLLSLVG